METWLLSAERPGGGGDREDGNLRRGRDLGAGLGLGFGRRRGAVSEEEEAAVAMGWGWELACGVFGRTGLWFGSSSPLIREARRQESVRDSDPQRVVRGDEDEGVESLGK